LALTAIESLDANKVRLYVIWEPVWIGNIEKKAKRAAKQLGASSDGKATQFWTPDLAIAQALVEPLGWGSGRQTHASGENPWDLYAAYPAGVRWDAGAPIPNPSAWTSPIVHDELLAERLRELSEASPP
jgi:hypothetical protein